MKALSKEYQEKLEAIARSITDSPELAAYLEEEDESSYKALIESFEPMIEELYEEVSLKEPLMLIEFEDTLLDQKFEGLFLPRILGYNILRAEVNEHYKYTRTPERVDKILKAICDNPNFDYLTHRIGQSVQILFALGSDIWATNFIEHVHSKRQKHYLLSQKLPKYLHEHERKNGYLRYSRQFANFSFQTCQFPKDSVENRLYFFNMASFLKSRAAINQYNSSFVPEFIEYLKNKSFHFTREHTLILGLIINYFDLEEKDRKEIAKILNSLRDASNFSDIYFGFLLERFDSKLSLNSDCDRRVAKFVDFNLKEDELSRYYRMAEILATKGFMHDDAINAVQSTYAMYEGMSLFNECVRRNILGYFTRFISNLEPDAYNDYFETDKYYKVYISIFANEQFNQELRTLSQQFLKKLLKTYTDKRSREYQDIKKFFTQQFSEYNFMKEKEIAEYFKTKKKRSSNA